MRAALAAVEGGYADAAIVYRSDAAVSQKVKVGWSVAVERAPAIVYPVAVVAGSREAEEAGRFADFLNSEDARKIFVARGFGRVKE